MVGGKRLGLGRSRIEREEPAGLVIFGARTEHSLTSIARKPGDRLLAAAPTSRTAGRVPDLRRRRTGLAMVYELHLASRHVYRRKASSTLRIAHTGAAGQVFRETGVGNPVGYDRIFRPRGGFCDYRQDVLSIGR